jgi:hypothetical protein
MNGILPAILLQAAGSLSNASSTKLSSMLSQLWFSVGLRIGFASICDLSPALCC